VITDTLIYGIIGFIVAERTKSPFRLCIPRRIGGSSPHRISMTHFRNGGHIRTFIRPSTWWTEGTPTRIGEQHDN
jgi:hypothetical protein